MSDLPTPINRHEQYLNAIANGTTDNLPTPPITREEVFLDYIARNGGGGGGGDVTGVKGNAEGSYRRGNVNLTPENLGLGNVNNTSDANKPVSTAQQTALDGKVDKVVGKGLSTNDYDNTAKGIVDGVTTALAGKVSTTSVGSANGVAELDANGKVPSAQLPSYVDDTVEGYLNSVDGKFYADSSYTTEITGETGKIYVTLDTNKTYRWSGSGFVEISESLALGETSSTAYAGNKGKANADAIAGIKNGTSINSFSAVETALQSCATKTYVDGLVGDPSSATTTDKSSVVAMVNELDWKAGTFGPYNVADATDIKDFIKKVITLADADLASKPAYKIYHIFSTYHNLDNFHGTIERQDTHGYSFVLNVASGNVVYRGYCDLSTNYLNVYRYTSIPIGQATLGTGFIAAFHDGSAYRCFVPFPFWASDTNYTVALNGVSQVNVGNVLASASVETKYRTGFVLIVSGTYDYSKCGIAVNYTVTLN